MTDHGATVAAVLAKAIYHEAYHPQDPCDEWMVRDAKWTLETLTTAGYAVVKLPEGVAVEHGARLVPADGIVIPAELEPVLNPRSGLPMYWPPKDQPPLYAIEATP